MKRFVTASILTLAAIALLSSPVAAQSANYLFGPGSTTVNGRPLDTFTDAATIGEDVLPLPAGTYNVATSPGTVVMDASGNVTNQFVLANDGDPLDIRIEPPPTGGAFTITATGPNGLTVVGTGTYYALTPSAGANGTITTTGWATVRYQGNQTFSIVPNPGYHVADVSVDGGSVGPVTSYTFSAVNLNHSISATFAPNASANYTITPSAGPGGTISPAVPVSVNTGGSQTFTMSPSTGYNVSQVLVDGTPVLNPTTTYTFSNVTSDHTISVTFAVIQYPINASASVGGSISPNGILEVNYGGNQSYTITPDLGHHIVDVVVDGASQGAITTYAFTNVTSTHVISATFQINTYPIIASAGTGGTITPSGTQTINYGTTPAFNIAPSTGYHVADVQVDNVSVGPVLTYTFASISAAHTIVATFAINTYTLAATGTNGSIVKSPDQSLYDYGTAVQLTATPATGYHFVSWGGDASGSANPLTITMDANKNITANFAINTYTLSVTATNGTVSKSPEQPNYNHGTSVQLTAVPATGYHFDSWSGDVTGTTSPVSVTMDANKSVTANFAINTFTVTPTAGANGTISPSTLQTVNYGTSSTFTIAPSLGYHVADVLVDGSSVGAVTSYTFTNVTANHTISASFANTTFTLTPTAGTNGTISPSTLQTVNYGTSSTFTIAPSPGYHVADVLVDGVSVGAVTSYTFTNVIANHTISASFAITTFTLTPTAGTNGTISPSTLQTVNYGTSSTFTIAPSPGYHVADVLVDGVSVGAVTSYTFTNVIANHTIAASFAITTFTLTPTAGANGTISPSTLQTVNYGTSSTFTIAPSLGYHVADVLVDGSSVGAVTSYTFTNVTANHTISASFANTTFTLTPTAGTNGTISPSTLQTVNYGTSSTFTIAPSPGYHVADVLVDGVSVGAVTSYTFTNVIANHTISASFAITTFTLTPTAGTNGTISPSTLQTVNYGTSSTFTIAPSPGYHVADVLVDGVSVGAVTSYTFTNVIANHTIAASFAITTFTITPTAGANGTITPSSVQTVNYGASSTFTVAPSTGQVTVDVLVDGVSQGSITTYTFTNVVANHTIAASFAAAPVNTGAIAGAGYVPSPAGAFVKTPTFTGRGYFAFAAGYVGKNPVVPTGFVQYLLKSRSLFGSSAMNFSSTQFDALVVSGSQGTLKGTGTIDGSGSYGFLLSVIDGQLFNGNKLRLKIWDKNHGNAVAYDNQMGAGDDASPTGAVTGLISVSKSGGSTTSTNLSVEQVMEEVAATEIPTEYELYNAYPNPFNPSTTIRFDLPDAARVRLVVYDMLGREVALLVDEERPAGQHAVKFDAGKLSSGVYIYRLQAGNFVQTKKLMLMK